MAQMLPRVPLSPQAQGVRVEAGLACEIAQQRGAPAFEPIEHAREPDGFDYAVNLFCSIAGGATGARGTGGGERDPAETFAPALLNSSFPRSMPSATSRLVRRFHRP
jgi:hypothetical protein